ncbi:MAG: glutamine amidotransferase, partial [Candidatus Poribacteria bacterium]
RNHTYKVSIEPNIDTIRENNYSQAFINSVERRKILYVNGNAEAKYLPKILEKGNLNVTVIEDMSKFPSSITELKDYGAVIFDNISAYSLSENQIRMIETYVHDIGGGFLMIGGENSFGNGGYHKTPIEKILPVKMIPEEKKRSVSIMLLIDKSGSMNALSGNLSKIDLAKSASISVVDMLTDKDKIGVIAFDAKADEIVQLNKTQSKDQIVDSISTIKARGGTNLYPALKNAYSALQKSDSQIKHIIILSDGRSLQMEESLSLAKQLARESITISSVVISDEADKKFMNDIAQIGSGRYYETDNAGNLSKLFIKETFIASKLIMEEDFQPIISSNSEILKGIASIPKLKGYIGTSIKEGAELILKSHNDDPILARWQYGLGKTLAFTSDSQAKWALEWLKWDNYGKFWSQAVNWCISNAIGEFDVTSFIKGSKGYITVDAVNAFGQLRNFLNLNATIVKPNLTTENIKLKQSGLGKYEAEFDADQKGVYLLSVTEMNNGSPIAIKNMGLTVSYSPEYNALLSNNKLLEVLASSTGGKYLPEIEDIISRKSKSVKKIQEMWRWLLIVVIPLFFFDVAIRRITLSKDQLYEIFGRLSYKAQKQTTENKTFTYLKSRKGGIIDFKVIKKIDVVPDLQARKNQIVSKNESYTSRLLSAKKRANNKLE